MSQPQKQMVFICTPENFFLVYNKKEEEWTLNYRIDRSEKGKDDDIGTPRIILSGGEAEDCKKLGFSWITL